MRNPLNLDSIKVKSSKRIPVLNIKLQNNLKESNDNFVPKSISHTERPINKVISLSDFSNQKI